MAETKDLPESAAVFGKTAHQLSETGGEPPENYIWTNKTEVDAPLATDMPVIDVSLLASSTDAELNALHSALTKWGCFQIVNHGIESASLMKCAILPQNSSTFRSWRSRDTRGKETILKVTAAVRLFPEPNGLIGCIFKSLQKTVENSNFGLRIQNLSSKKKCRSSHKIELRLHN
ncbi:uncharacterized protein LOC121749587 [Salvia splendens]|uniref:uncharacterized protein LOC121749587 n=1 Tax=Salvia splendens TaxID=180675 RepID=UPI001C257EB2|nr:uncharacterized protein LOC121749587 [Salvia splendens]